MNRTMKQAHARDTACKQGNLYQFPARVCLVLSLSRAGFRVLFFVSSIAG